MNALIPSLESLPASPKCIILHWTAGGPKASALEKQHYHYLIEQPDGRVVPGMSVAENMDGTGDGIYAAHTRGLNTRSVGIAFCGMRGSEPGRKFGPYPLTEEQVRNGLRFVAECCLAWRLNPLDPEHLFTHYEAETLHGVDQLPIGPGTWKWDITELKFAPHLKKDEVGQWLREQTSERLWELLPEPKVALVQSIMNPIAFPYAYRYINGVLPG